MKIFLHFDDTNQSLFTCNCLPISLKCTATTCHKSAKTSENAGAHLRALQQPSPGLRAPVMYQEMILKSTSSIFELFSSNKVGQNNIHICPFFQTKGWAIMRQDQYLSIRVGGRYKIWRGHC